MSNSRKILVGLVVSASLSLSPENAFAFQKFPSMSEICGMRIAGEEKDDPIHQEPNWGRIASSSEENLYTRKITNTYNAWNITQGNNEVLVGLVDSGIDVTHPDLRDNLWVNEAEAKGKAGVDDDGNGYIDDIHGWDFVTNKPLSRDGTGHGTHCAGNIAASQNGIGVVGVAPRAKVIGVRFIGNNGSGSTNNAIRGLIYAAENGARVISNSWGGSSSNTCLSKVLGELQRRGVIIVASANNNGRNTDVRPSYPANYSGVIAVGNSDERDRRSSGSNYGIMSVHIFAPGTRSYSTYPNNRYATLSGTSMAAPQVAGAIALGLSIAPNLTVSQVRDALCAGADPILKTVSKCGRMNVLKFLEKLESFR